jgi:AraC-like DNA-binding protein
MAPVGKRVATQVGGFELEREIVPLGAGLVQMRQTYRVETLYRGTLATGPHWLFAQVRLRGGRAGFRVAGGIHWMEASYALFIAPFTVVRFFWPGCEMESSGVLGAGDVGPAQGAFVWTPVSHGDPTTIPGVRAHLDAAHARTSVHTSARARSLAGRLKRSLDAGHAEPRPLSELARALGTTPSAQSRAFRRTFGLAPLAYRQRLQIMDAIVRLAGGERIAAAALDVGFGDLSRFYKQFARHAHSSPASYRCPPPGS